MELRCASKSDLTQWGNPIWIYPSYFYRALPYDPVRPWKDVDGKWYSSWSSDGCNATTRRTPCEAGGQLELLVSPSLHGPEIECPNPDPNPDPDRNLNPNSNPNPNPDPNPNPITL